MEIKETIEAGKVVAKTINEDYATRTAEGVIVIHSFYTESITACYDKSGAVTKATYAITGDKDHKIVSSISIINNSDATKTATITRNGVEFVAIIDAHGNVSSLKHPAITENLAGTPALQLFKYEIASGVQIVEKIALAAREHTDLTRSIFNENIPLMGTPNSENSKNQNQELSKFILKLNADASEVNINSYAATNLPKPQADAIKLI